MLARVLCVVLLMSLAAAANAQSPSPSSSMAPRGSREATERALAAYNKALADYEAVSAKPGSDVRDMGNAYNAAVDAGKVADAALDDEVGRSPDVLAAGKKLYAKQQALDAAKANKRATSEQMIKAQIEHQNTKQNFDRLFEQGRHEILKELHQTRLLEPAMTSRHGQLIQKMQEAALKAHREREQRLKIQKAEADKTKQSRNSSTVKSNCAPPTTLAGAMNNLACKEQHGG